MTFKAGDMFFNDQSTIHLVHIDSTHAIFKELYPRDIVHSIMPKSSIEKYLEEKHYKKAEPHWYPDDSGEWVEVDGSVSSLPDELNQKDLIEVLTKIERTCKNYLHEDGLANEVKWDYDEYNPRRAVAFKVVKKYKQPHGQSKFGPVLTEVEKQQLLK